MTVEELIKQLQEMPQTARVMLTMPDQSGDFELPWQVWCADETYVGWFFADDKILARHNSSARSALGVSKPEQVAVIAYWNF